MRSMVEGCYRPHGPSDDPECSIHVGEHQLRRESDHLNALPI